MVETEMQKSYAPGQVQIHRHGIPLRNALQDGWFVYH